MDGSHEKILPNYRRIRIERSTPSGRGVYLELRTRKPKNDKNGQILDLR